MKRLRLLEAVGFLLLVPWFVLHGAVAAGWAGLPLGGVAAVAGHQLAFVWLFVLPLVSLTLGIACLHTLLWTKTGRAAFALLVFVASFCLVGSVIHDSIRFSRDVETVRLVD